MPINWLVYICVHLPRQNSSMHCDNKSKCAVALCSHVCIIHWCETSVPLRIYLSLIYNLIISQKYWKRPQCYTLGNLNLQHNLVLKCAFHLKLNLCFLHYWQIKILHLTWGKCQRNTVLNIYMLIANVRFQFWACPTNHYVDLKIMYISNVHTCSL